MPRAYVTLRHTPPYRSDAFSDGLETIGYNVFMKHPSEVEPVGPGDVVVTWNLSTRYEKSAQRARAAGAALVVAENGYIQNGVTTHYAVARDGHNGSGFWFVEDDGDRWRALGVPLRPWSHDPDGFVMIADQRGIGSCLMRSPRDFGRTAEAKVRKMYASRGLRCPEIRVRPHPGRPGVESPAPLLEALRGAAALVTWSSNAANVALHAGVPSFRLAPHHVNFSVIAGIDRLPELPLVEREPGFTGLSWAQWSLEEIGDGTAFRHVLRSPS